MLRRDRCVHDDLPLLFRSGLLSGVAMGATMALLYNSALTLDPGAWYWPRALTVMLIVVAAAAWAALGSRARWAGSAS